MIANFLKKIGHIEINIFLTSFCILFFELICIRWIPAYVFHFGFFSNYILLASFLGIGIGILIGENKNNLIKINFHSIVLVIVSIIIFSQLEVNLNSNDILHYATENQALKIENFISLPIIFILITCAFIQLSRPLGFLLPKLPPLNAYAIDILGSMIGIITFFVLSYYSLPPIIWFSILFIATSFTFKKTNIIPNFFVIFLTLAIIFISGKSSSYDTYWSPYYKVTGLAHSNEYSINVNNIPHQAIKPYDKKESLYHKVYEIFSQNKFNNVLIIGAGTGSDIAIALHYGVKHIDAVEIDPVIYNIGKRLHPDHPYQDRRVNVHINDGRAFLQTNQSKYDLIIFALPDSLTLLTSFSNLRLESFLLTLESLKKAHESLTNKGILVLYNYYRKDWFIYKLASMLQLISGEKPYVTTYGSWGRAAVFMSGPLLNTLNPQLNIPYSENNKPQIQTNLYGAYKPIVGQGRMTGNVNQPLATDDWPFIYMRAPTIPIVYIITLGTLMLGAFFFIKKCSPKDVLKKFNWHFFFLGSAFMMLETRSLVSFSLLFGSTWIVNSLVFFSILFSVLLAILVNLKFKTIPIKFIYCLLFVFLIINYFMPTHMFLAIPIPLLRYVACSTLFFMPIFLANIVFSHSFKNAEAANIAFASNMLGAMVGGGFEYLALAFGYQSLLLIVIIFYILAIFIKNSMLEKSLIHNK
ncbi:MAG: hypothetical protein V4525_07275 [Pseudomonadota bacterium]